MAQHRVTTIPKPHPPTSLPLLALVTLGLSTPLPEILEISTVQMEVITRLSFHLVITLLKVTLTYLHPVLQDSILVPVVSIARMEVGMGGMDQPVVASMALVGHSLCSPVVLGLIQDQATTRQAHRVTNSNQAGIA